MIGDCLFGENYEDELKEKDESVIDYLQLVDLISMN